MFIFKLPTLLKLWMGAAAVATGIDLYERAQGQNNVDPYLTLGKERYDVLARFVMLNDRNGFMKKLDAWGVKDMEMCMGVWRFISSKCG